MKRLIVVIAAMALAMAVAVPAIADACVNMDGDVRVGDPNFCDAQDGGTAIAINGSDALAWGDGTLAIAVNGSGAFVYDATDSTAVAVNQSQADAFGGANNRAIAVNCSAAVADGDGVLNIGINNGAGLCNPG